MLNENHFATVLISLPDKMDEQKTFNRIFSMFISDVDFWTQHLFDACVDPRLLLISQVYLFRSLSFICVSSVKNCLRGLFTTLPWQIRFCTRRLMKKIIWNHIFKY